MGIRSTLRRYGADGPFADPREPHGSPVEGWYWRIALPGHDRVVAVMGGVGQHAGMPWGNVVLALHPEHEDRERVVLAGVEASASKLIVGDALQATRGRLEVAVGDVRLQCRLQPTEALRGRLWGALGPGHLIPGLGQHWTPIELAIVTEGTVVIAGTRIDLAGGRVYHERNWGSAFPRRGWWWGAAHAFDDPALAVAFAGGPLGPRPLPAPTAVVIRTRRGLHRFGLPQHVAAACGPGTWDVEARGIAARARLSGRATDAGLLLSHPAGGRPGEVERLARQHLAGTLDVLLERRASGRWRTELAATSTLVGLEHGLPG